MTNDYSSLPFGVRSATTFTQPQITQPQAFLTARSEESIEPVAVQTL